MLGKAINGLVLGLQGARDQGLELSFPVKLWANVPDTEM